MLNREQFYLDLLFKSAGGDTDLILNKSSTAGSTLGYKHSLEFKLKRSGILNPMHPDKVSSIIGRKYSDLFLHMQNRNKTGINNPLFGVKKSLETISKLQKLIYVYDTKNMSLIGTYPTVKCSKTFKIGKDTLSKYLKSGLPLKGKFFSKIKLHT